MNDLKLKCISLTNRKEKVNYSTSPKKGTISDTEKKNQEEQTRVFWLNCLCVDVSFESRVLGGIPAMQSSSDKVY